MADDRRGSPTRRAVGGALALALVAGAGWWVGHRPAGQRVQAQVPLATAVATRTHLSATTQVDGALGYTTPTVIVAGAAGMLTALPAPGQVVGRGQTLYEMDGRAVPLFAGTRPEWRALRLGVPAGPDVGELNANLRALGFGAPEGASFTAATAAAVVRWETAMGWAPTGAVAAGEIAYGVAPMRVGQLNADLGAVVQPGTSLFAGTSTSLVVQAEVPVGDAHLVATGDAVTVTLPDGHATVPGVVASVSPVPATPPTPSGGPGEPTVPTVISLSMPVAGGNLDQAPVTVNIVTSQAADALAVPVNALVALAGGGYGVQVVDGSRRSLVAVQTGLFAGSLVQVSGGGLVSGTAVVVPAP